MTRCPNANRCIRNEPAFNKPVLPTGPGAATVDRAKARMCEAARPRTKTLPKTMTDLMPRSVFSFSALLRDKIHKKENHAP